MGRPPAAEPRTTITPVRLTETEKKTLQAAANIAGFPLGRMIREDALEAAERRIQRAAENGSS